ncbi:MAG: hypothetical protein A2284_11360 [Deltaproteobacteria bacterium RIFOXYA12_FULL_61_11]|nr:MAG: hypothetical protein A2284_11360 [Deltaproteobacteria bacterium RIFOXYA12_FULL_61_11]
MRILEVKLLEVTLQSEVEVHNLDDRDAHIEKIHYQIEVEGTESKEETLERRIELLSGTTVVIPLLVTLPLLSSLRFLLFDTVEYRIWGRFWAETPLGLLDFPLDVQGEYDLDGRELLDEAARTARKL